MKSTLLLVLLSSAAFAQVPRPPPPPPMIHTSPPTGAPTGPQVGPIPRGPGVPPALPPSPNKRVLPPESKPGIWSADTMASNADKVSKRIEAAPATPAGLPEAAWGHCWNTTQTCLLAEASAVAASDAAFNCLRMQFAAVCGGQIADYGESGVKATLAKYGRGPYSHKDFSDATRDMKRRECAKMNAADLSTFDRLYESLYARCAPKWRQ